MKRKRKRGRERERKRNFWFFKGANRFEYIILFNVEHKINFISWSRIPSEKSFFSSWDCFSLYKIESFWRKQNYVLSAQLKCKPTVYSHQIIGFLEIAAHCTLHTAHITDSDTQHLVLFFETFSFSFFVSFWLNIMNVIALCFQRLRHHFFWLNYIFGMIIIIMSVNECEKFQFYRNWIKIELAKCVRHNL